MKITLTDYVTGKLVAERKVTQCEFGYVFDLNPKTFFDEFEQALYALNNGKPEGVIADNWSDDYKTPIIALTAFWLGFAIVAFVYIDMAFDILAN